MEKISFQVDVGIASSMLLCTSKLKEMTWPSSSMSFEGLTDNSTAKNAVREGFSQGLRHLRKHHRVSIGLMSDVYSRPDARCARVPSKWNCSDIFTKALGRELHERHALALGLATRDELLSSRDGKCAAEAADDDA